jgi:lipoprotein-anchoring transpeptidase ErfK/SrfK
MLLRRLAALGLAGCTVAGTLAGCASSGSSSASGGAPSGAGMPRRYVDYRGVDVSSGAVPGSAAPSPAPSGSASAVPPPPPDACAGNRAAKRVLVDLSDQRLWFCEGSHTARATPITSGMSGPDTSTPTGRYRIQGLNRDTVLTLSSGATYDVKYWIPFDAPLYGFHDSSWQRFPYGSARYRTDGSHGCVHLPLRQIAFLYRWAPVGTPVTIRR